ncbi:MAG: four helix bundle protein [Patescibacteria group bacterium]|jgi:four helix bundle protein
MEFRYERIEAGEPILKLIDRICVLVGFFPQDEKWILGSQIRRAANSVFLNLAEGSARRSYKEFARFLTISMASLAEVHACLVLARRRNYINQKCFDEIQPLIEEVWFKLWNLRESQIKKARCRFGQDR